MGKRRNPYQRTLQLRVEVREPTTADLREAYERCVSYKDRLPFERALTVRAIALAIRNAAKAAILRRGGV